MKRLPFQLYAPDDISGIVTEDHLGNRFLTQPQQMDQVITMIAAVNWGPNLLTELKKYPIKYMESDDPWEWRLIGNADKSVPLVKASLSPGGSPVTSNDKFGIGKTIGYLYFTERFNETEVLVGERGSLYQLRIVEEPKAVGNLFEHAVQLMGGDLNKYVPAEELAAGKRFTVDFAPAERTLSVKGGGVRYTFPFIMRNTFSKIRIEDTVPGNMIHRPVVAKWVDPESKKVMTTWMAYRSFELERQWQKQIANLLYWGVSNQAADGTYLDKGKSGHIIQMGAGLRQQIEQSGIKYYNKFDIKVFTEIVLDQLVGKVPPELRKVKVKSGEWGMIQFSESLEKYSTLYTPSRDNNRIYSLGGNKMGFRGQFIKYDGPNGLELTIEHDPIKDDLVRNNLRVTGLRGPVESYTYDIISLVTQNGGPNVQLVRPKDNYEIRSFMPGLINPFNLKHNNMYISSSGVDGWTEFRMFTGGVQVNDPTACLVYKLSV